LLSAKVAKHWYYQIGRNAIVAQPTEAVHRWFYGWVIVVAAMIGIGCSFSVLIISITGIFAEPLRAAMGWSVEQIYLGSSVAGVCGVLTAPLIGALGDRLGVRRILALAFVLEALILASFNWLDTNISGYLLRYGALAVFCVGTTQVLFGRVISAWFNRRLGVALGIALAGVGVGGAFWSVVSQRLIDLYGWRHAYLGIAAIIAGVAFPLVLLLIRDSPDRLGQTVDGASPALAAAPAFFSVNTGMTLIEASRTTQYWLMIAVFSLVGIALQSIQFHLVPLLISRGSSAQLAAATQAALWSAVVIGRISSGWFLDRSFAPRVAQLYLIPPIVGISALTLGVSGGWALVAAMCIGLAVGGESDVVAYLVRRYFGLKHYSRIYGTFFSAYGIASAIGPSWTAWALKNLAGGYSAALWVHSCLLALAIVVLSWYQPYRTEMPVAAEPLPAR
jgi:MFS transporter, OFA family, oxalate/formate antiporter